MFQTQSHYMQITTLSTHMWNLTVTMVTQKLVSAFDPKTTGTTPGMEGKPSGFFHPSFSVFFQDVADGFSESTTTTNETLITAGLHASTLGCSS